MHEAARAAEQAARTSYGRLVAILAGRTCDLAAVEDALAEAFGAALATWPARGVPDRPEAWLLTAARRVLGHGQRHARVRAAAAQALHLLAEEAEDRMTTASPFPDERLGLLFVCAHPAIDRSVHTPLMLQTVLGLDAARIAGAFATTAAAMGQRLVRAKAKIRDAGIAFAVPGADQLAERLDPVLEAIYAAYGTGWDAPDGRDLTAEALFLCRLTADLLPGEPEVLGLLALLLHCEARSGARRGAGGAFVPLAAQDTALWDRGMIAAAEQTLGRAFALRRIGHFQIEAAIQSAHAGRAATGRVDWAGIVRLYDALIGLAPGLGALVGRAAALAEAGEAQVGLAALEAIAGADGYQPWWAVRAHLLQLLGRTAEAAAAYARAGSLASDPAVREFLRARAADA